MVHYDVDLSFFGGKVIKPGQWPSRMDREGMEHVKSLANRGKRMLQQANIEAIMSSNWTFQKTGTETIFETESRNEESESRNEETETRNEENGGEEESQRKRRKVGASCFINDECEVEGESSTEDECQMTVTIDDCDFINDIATDSNWSDYINM